MIKSMTGYGGAKGRSGKLDISIELRSVNNRYLDCNIRIPRMYTAFEDAIKAMVQKYISRGKVDVYVTIDSSNGGDVEININEALADGYMNALAALAEKYGLSSEISAVTLARFPDVLTVERVEADTETLQADICSVLEEALGGFDRMRLAEGQRLHSDMVSRLAEIDRLVALAETRSPQTVLDYRARLEAKIRETLQNRDIDEGRILTEVAIFADRVAINEEIVRLKSHLAQFAQILGLSEPVGRKLDFLIQELNREANTMGSKGNDAEMAKIVVDIKSEIEKIREQIQNVE